MPIVFVHGVATRADDRKNEQQLRTAELNLRRFVAPMLAPDPENVTVINAYWGDIGVSMAWNGASVPGAEPLRFTDHPLVTLFEAGGAREIAREVGRRGLNIPGYLASRAVSLARQRLSQQAIIFLGDAALYLATRGVADQIGAIPQRVLDALITAHAIKQERNGEPLVVLSHSMGGQIMYDLFTYFLPHKPKLDLFVDFWASASSQIGLFEELKLFIASSPDHGPRNPVPFPDRKRLGHWLNVWDPHDYLSFTVRGIIEDVEDEDYDSGLAVTGAHFGCIKQPSFYTLLAQKVRTHLAVETLSALAGADQL